MRTRREQDERTYLKIVVVGLLIIVIAFAVFIYSIISMNRMDAEIIETDAFIAQYEADHDSRGFLKSEVLHPVENETININYDGTFGNMYSYEGYFLITCKESKAYEWKDSHGWAYDPEGFAVYEGSYIIACRDTFGEIGDVVTFNLANGKEISCIIGDHKADDANANKYGHVSNGYLNTVEFCVSEDWYTGHENPGTVSCHPEWESRILYAEIER